MKNAYSPLERLTALEELSLKLFDAIKKMEGEKMGLKERIEALEQQIRPQGVDYGLIYDTLREIELTTAPLAPDETEEQWEARFVEENGTREQFINKRTKKEDK